MQNPIERLFPTLLDRAEVPHAASLNIDLEDAALALSQHDVKGLRWCEKHGYAGYTSYASISDLSDRSAPFARLETIIHLHAAALAKALQWKLQGGQPTCDSMWLNVLPQLGSHPSPIPTNAITVAPYLITPPAGSRPSVF